jgi:hypothetical protein
MIDFGVRQSHLSPVIRPSDQHQDGDRRLKTLGQVDNERTTRLARPATLTLGIINRLKPSA